MSRIGILGNKPLVSALLSVAICVACGGRSDGQDVTAHNPSLIVLPGAANVRYTSDYDGVVKYELRVAFPAAEVIGAINEDLKKKGMDRQRI